MMRWLWAWLLMIFSLPLSALTVVTSTAPLQYYTTILMQGLGTPVLLIPANASEHTYALKPSQYQAVKTADLVIWFGPALEGAISKLMNTLPATTRLTLLESDLPVQYPLRTFEGDGHEHSTGLDPHVWYDPENAKAIVKLIEAQLIQKDPIHQTQYETNAAQAFKAIDDNQQIWQERLKPIQGKAVWATHDAFQYLEKRYDFKVAGILAPHPDIPVSVRRALALRQSFEKGERIAVLTEVNHPAAILKTVKKQGIPIIVIPSY